MDTDVPWRTYKKELEKLYPKEDEHSDQHISKDSKDSKDRFKVSKEIVKMSSPKKVALKDIFEISIIRE